MIHNMFLLNNKPDYFFLTVGSSSVEVPITVEETGTSCLPHQSDIIICQSTVSGEVYLSNIVLDSKIVIFFLLNIKYLVHDIQRS